MMADVAQTLVTAVIAFASTNIDDIFVLMLFYGQGLRRRDVVFGQYLGFGALVAISLLGYLGTLAIPRAWIGLLGLVPIALGIRALIKGGADDDEEVPPAPSSRLRAWLNPQISGVASVTFANGGDNIGIYVPLFARGSGLDLAVTIGVFFVLVAVWCAAAAVLARHPAIAALLDRYGHRLVPLVLIGLGIFILVESGTLGLLW